MSVCTTGDEYPPTKVALYCNTSGWAFGPIFDDRETAEAFLQFVTDRIAPVDIRQLTDRRLSELYGSFIEPNVGDEDDD